MVWMRYFLSAPCTQVQYFTRISYVVSEKVRRNWCTIYKENARSYRENDATHPNIKLLW